MIPVMVLWLIHLFYLLCHFGTLIVSIKPKQRLTGFSLRVSGQATARQNAPSGNKFANAFISRISTMLHLSHQTHSAVCAADRRIALSFALNHEAFLTPPYADASSPLADYPYTSATPALTGRRPASGARNHICNSSSSH